MQHSDLVIKEKQHKPVYKLTQEKVITSKKIQRKVHNKKNTGHSNTEQIKLNKTQDTRFGKKEDKKTDGFKTHKQQHIHTHTCKH